MSIFRAIVVRKNHGDLKNFIKVPRVDRELFKQECWDRNQIIEVHVISSRAFVAKKAKELQTQMLGFGKFVMETPKGIDARQSREWILKDPEAVDAVQDADAKLKAAKNAQDQADELHKEAESASKLKVKALETKARLADKLAKDAKEESKAVSS